MGLVDEVDGMVDSGIFRPEQGAFRPEQVFLIHAETGLLLAHTARSDIEVAAPDLVSAMLTAIRDFAEESFGASSSSARQMFSMGELNVFVEAGSRVLLAASGRGAYSGRFRRRLRHALRLIETRHSRTLEDFDGDPAPFEDTIHMLGSLLRTDTSPRVSGLWKLGLAAAVVAAALWLVVAPEPGESSLERETATILERLEAEPGYEILEARRNGERWHISGLRDPASRPAGEVFRSLGLDPSRVDAIWQDHQSVESSVVIARAWSALHTPPGVTLSLRGGTLVATGSAPSSWASYAAQRALQVPGITGFDASGLSLDP